MKQTVSPNHYQRYILIKWQLILNTLDQQNLCVQYQLKKRKSANFKQIIQSLQSLAFNQYKIIIFDFNIQHQHKFIKQINQVMSQIHRPNLIFQSISQIQTQSRTRIKKHLDVYCLESDNIKMIQKIMNGHHNHKNYLIVNSLDQVTEEIISTYYMIECKTRLPQVINQIMLHEQNISLEIIKEIFLQNKIDIVLTTTTKYLQQQIKKLKVINRYTIYELLIDNWYIQQKKKHNAVILYRLIYQQIAFMMLLNDQSQISKQILYQYQCEQLLSSLSLFKQVNQSKYCFICPSILYFHATRYIIQQILNLRYQSKSYQFIKSNSICIFIKEWYSSNRSIKNQLIHIVLQSRLNKSIQRSAAAAITILNMVGVRFSSMDLSRISIPYAILTGGYFDNTNLQDSNLQYTIFDRSYCVNTRLNRSDIRGISFGETMNINYQQTVRAIDFDSTGKYMILGGYYGKILIYEIKGMKKIKQLKNIKYIHRIKYSPCGKIIVICSADHIIQILNLNTHTINYLQNQGHINSILSFSYSPDGNKIATAGYDKSIKIWDVQKGINIKTFQQNDSTFLDLCYSPDGKIIVSSSYDKLLKIWNVQTGQKIKTIRGINNLWSLDYSPDENKIVNGSFDHSIKIFNISTGKIAKTLFGHSNSVQFVSYSSDGKRIISGGKDNKIKIWNAETGAHIKSFQEHIPLLTVRQSPNGKLIASSNDDKIIKIWANNNFECFSSLSEAESLNFYDQVPEYDNSGRQFQSYNIRASMISSFHIQNIEYNSIVAFDHIFQLISK